MEPNEGLKGFAGSASIFCGQIAACWTWIWLMAKQDKKNAEKKKAR
jgi:hypothetical protein